jgi:hypothetical protein
MASTISAEPDTFTTIMKLRTVAQSDKEIYAATDDDGSYYIFRLDDGHKINLGDVLRGDFNGAGSLFVTVENVTQRRKVGIGLEELQCSLNGAIENLLTLSHPEKVFAGTKCVRVDARDAALVLHEEIVDS